MKNEMALVQSIIEHIRTNRLNRTVTLEDLAESYANLCIEVNNRLLKCQEFLQKGMRSEAIYEATLTPALLEIVVVIQFQEFNRWRNICQELELPIPPQILIDIVERLHNEIPKEQELEPLLKQYRRAVHHGEIRDSMDILRKIIPLDANNKVWKENLAALEDEYYDSQLADIEDALDLNDLQALQRFYDDAIHPTRTLPFPVELLSRVRRALLAEQSAELTIRADQICQQLRQYIPEHKASMIKPLLDQWTSLNNNEAFEPKDEHLAIITQANAEILLAEKEKTIELKKEKLLEDLRAVISLEIPNVKAIATALEAIRYEEIELPEDLQNSIDAAYQRIGKIQRRRKNVIISVIGGVGILTLGGLFGVYWHLNQQNKMNSALIEIRTCIEKQQHVAAEKLLHESIALYPSLVRNPTYIELQEQVTKIQAIHENVQKNYHKILKTLQEIANNRYQENISEIEGLLAQVKKDQAVLSPEQVGRISAWEQEYRVYLNKTKEIETERIKDICRQGEDVLLMAKKSDKRQLTENLEKVKKSQIALSAYQGKLELVPESLQERWKDIYEKHYEAIRYLEKEIGSFADKNKNYASLKRQIGESLEDLGLYGSLLERFSAEFPETTESVYYKRTIDNLKYYNAVLDLNEISFMGTTDSAKRTQMVNEILKKYKGTRTSIWVKDIEEWNKYTEVATRLQNLALGFGEDDYTKELFKNLFEVSQLRYRIKGNKDWQSLFFPIVGSDNKPSQIYSRATKDGTRYWLKEVYHKIDDNTGKRFDLVHTSQIFSGDGLIDSKYELNPDDYRRLSGGNQVANFLPPRVFLDKFCNDLGSQEKVEEFIVNKIQEALIAAQNSQLYSVAYASLAKFWISCLYQAIGNTNNNPYEESFRTSEHWDLNIAWFAVSDGQVSILRNTIIKDFSTIQLSLSNALAKRQNCLDALSYALSRQVRVAGMIDYNDKEEVFIRDSFALPSDSVNDIWILETGAAQPFFKKIGVRQNKSFDISNSILNQLKPGQLLFAPIFSDKVKESSLKIDDFIPTSWPKDK